MVHYLDTSALVKLVVAEAESAALRGWLTAHGSRHVTSDLVRTELLRAVRRVAPNRVVLAREVLSAVDLLALSSDVLDTAGRLDPADLRSLDALHLASALALGDDLDGMVTYDLRLADAARALGIPVVAPGAGEVGAGAGTGPGDVPSGR